MRSTAGLLIASLASAGCEPNGPAANPQAAAFAVPAPAPARVPQEPIRVFPTRVIKTGMTKAITFSLSPDGGTVACAGAGNGSNFPEHTYGTVYIDIATGKPVGVPGVARSPGFLTRDGKSALVIDGRQGQQGNIVVCDIATGKEMVVANIAEGRARYSVTPDGAFVVTCRVGGDALAFVTTSSGEPAFPTVTTTTPIVAMSDTFLDGTRVATLHRSGRVALWDLTTGTQVGDLATGRPPSESMDFEVAADGRTMRLNWNGPEEIWDLPTQRLVYRRPIGDFYRHKAIPGGRTCHAATRFGDGLRPRDGQVTNEAAVDCFAVADAATMADQLLLIFDGEPSDDSWEMFGSFAVSTDGKRVVALREKSGRLYVFDLPVR